MMQTVTNFDKVGHFMRAFGQEVKNKPEFPNIDTQALRYDLIKEELNELYQAMGEKDMVEVADALTDLLYVVYGTGHAFGINLDVCFNVVHRSNMSKLGPDYKPIYRNDGKVMKGPNYVEPDLHKALYPRTTADQGVAATD